MPEHLVEEIQTIKKAQIDIQEAVQEIKVVQEIIDTKIDHLVKVANLENALDTLYPVKILNQDGDTL